MTTNEIRKLISKGKVKEAIDALGEVANSRGLSELSTEVALHSGKYSKNERDNRMGIISSDDYLRNRNRITVAVLDLLTKVDQPTVEPEVTPPVPDNPSGTNNHSDKNKALSILFLASNPSGTSKIQLREEHSKVSEVIQDAINSGEIKLVKTKQATTFLDLQGYLLDEEPDIVHFSGHGKGKGSLSDDPAFTKVRDLVTDPNGNIKDETGIVLADDDQRSYEIVSTDVIKETFSLLVDIKQNKPIKLVLFNSCYSHAQAEAVAEFAEYVIGTSSRVLDEAAIAFATSFYLGLAKGRDLRIAYKLGRTAAMRKKEPKDRFILYHNGEKLTDI